MNDIAGVRYWSSRRRTCRNVLCYVAALSVLTTVNIYRNNHAVIRSPNDTHNGGGNSTLVIIMGNLRAGEVAWKSLYDNLLDPNQADLALIIGENISEPYQSASLLSRAKYLWQFHEYDDWGDAIDLVSPNWRNTSLPHFATGNFFGLFGGIRGRKGSGALIFMIRWFLSKEIQAAELQTKYERFVLTRSDHYYLCKQDLSRLDLRYAWVPHGESYGGVTDRHLVVSGDRFLDAIDVMPTMLEHYEEFGHDFNPEKAVARTWQLHGLGARFFRRVMFTTAQTNDTTRWRKPGRVLPGLGGLRAKYEREYDESLLVCARANRSGFVPPVIHWYNLECILKHLRFLRPFFLWTREMFGLSPYLISRYDCTLC